MSVALSNPEAASSVDAFGRLGFAAKGAVYMIVGGLALQTAVGAGGRLIDKKGALAYVASVPFGRALLGLLAVGLLGHALWRFIQAWRDTEAKGSSATGIARRLGYGIIGLAYAGIAVSAFRLLVGYSAGRSGDASARAWTAELLSQPLGRWLVAAAAVAVIGAGIYQWVRARRANFVKHLERQRLRAPTERWIVRLGRCGYVARGVVWFIAGSLLFTAALRAEPGRARGLSGSLAVLAREPFGAYLLALVAMGLFAYGVFMLAEARYRRMLLR